MKCKFEDMCLTGKGEKCGTFICCICEDECDFRGDEYNHDIPPKEEFIYDCLGAK